MNKIAAAFVQAQKGFAPALKTSANPHFKSRYADLAACVEAVIDALNSAGIALIQKSLDCDDGVKVETVFVHESGETLSGGVLHVPAAKQDPQGYGSALTYARRYALMAACGIAPEDDDGNAATQAKRNQQTNVRPMKGESGGAREISFKSLPAEWRSYLSETLAPAVDNACEQQGPAAAQAVIDGVEGMDNEIRAGLEYLLSSKTRSALKAHNTKEAA